MRIRDLVKTPMFWLFAVVLVAIAYAIYSMETKGGKVTAGTQEIKTTDPVTGQATNYQFNPRPYTDRLHETINSWTYVFSTSKPYTDLLGLSGQEIIAVAQDWNNRYYQENQETLLQAINAEYLATDLLDRINSRFASLNIS